MEDFPSNTRAARAARVNPNAPRTTEVAKPEPEKPQIQKIVTGKVEVRKKGIGTRLKETFLGGETRGVWDFVLMDVLRPAAQEMVSDAVSQGVERMVFGEVRSSGHRRGSIGRHSNAGNVNYNRMSGGTSIRRDPREIHDPRPTMSRQARRTHDFGEIIVSSRHEANEVLVHLDGLIQRFDQATVANLYEMLDMTPQFTDEKWGWEDLSTAGIRRARGGGYQLLLPQPEPLA